jgi:biotin operon repressor
MNDYPNTPGHRGVSTSIEAADAIESVTARLQRMALRAIQEAGSRGLTADELAATLDLSRWTIQPRTTELRRKHLVIDSGVRRLNVTGKRAIVWVAVDQQEQAA